VLPSFFITPTTEGNSAVRRSHYRDRQGRVAGGIERDETDMEVHRGLWMLFRERDGSRPAQNRGCPPASHPRLCPCVDLREAVVPGQSGSEERALEKFRPQIEPAKILCVAGVSGGGQKELGGT